MKQILHWSLMLMEYCPVLLPFNFSSLLLGGTRRSANSLARFSILSFLRAALCRLSCNLEDHPREKTLSASLSLNDLIMIYKVHRLAFNGKWYNLGEWTSLEW